MFLLDGHNGGENRHWLELDWPQLRQCLGALFPQQEIHVLPYMLLQQRPVLEAHLVMGPFKVQHRVAPNLLQPALSAAGNGLGPSRTDQQKEEHNERKSRPETCSCLESFHVQAAFKS